jgi:hypothetical protein
VGVNLFSQRLGEHVLVEREIGDEPLQPRILVFELAHAPDFVHAQMPEPLLPNVERRLADPGLAADIADRRPCLRLPERVRDLLLRKLRPLHPVPPLACEDRRERHDTLVVLGCRRFRGRGHRIAEVRNGSSLFTRDAGQGRLAGLL